MAKFDPIIRYQMHFILCQLHGLKPFSSPEFSMMEFTDATREFTKAMKELTIKIEALWKRLAKEEK